MTKPGERGIRRIISATGYSLKGFASCWRNEAAFRQEVVGAVVMAPLAFWLGNNSLEIALMIFTVMLVLIVELLNSSVEAAIDRISPEYHELSGQAKDMGAAAVMLSIGALLFTWVIVLFY